MKLTYTAAALCCAATSAYAGGFERSTLPLGFMYEDGTYAELSYGHVTSDVSGATLIPLAGGLIPAGTPSGNMAKNFSTVSLSFKTDLNEKISLGLTLDPTFGADLNYPAGTGYPIAGTNAELNGDTIALIGRYKLNDNFSVHAGLRSVGIGGNVTVIAPPNPTYAATYAMDRDVGYLVGLAYEKPEIALRVALTYASKTEHDMDTSIAGVGFVGTETIELPKSVTLDFQSGVAANTLVFGSIRWVDWTATRLNSIGYPVANQPLIGHDNDTITYSLGVGRKFNDNWSGAVSVGYEKSNGGIASNLSPTDGNKSIGLGVTYTQGNMKISGGVRYVKLGDANALSGVSSFADNSAVGVGLKVGWSF